jgi:hypothetical protein
MDIVPVETEVEEQIFDYPAEQPIDTRLQLSSSSSSSSLSLDTSIASSEHTHERPSKLYHAPIVQARKNIILCYFKILEVHQST